MAMEDDTRGRMREGGLEFGIIQGIVERGRDICEPHHIRECFVRRVGGTFIKNIRGKRRGDPELWKICEQT